MKQFFKKPEVEFFLIQLWLYLSMILMWTIVVLKIESERSVALESVSITAGRFFILWLLFAFNYYVLVPKLFEPVDHRKLRRWCFWLANLVLIVFVDTHRFASPDGKAVVWNEPARIGTYLYLCTWVVVCYAMVGVAIGRRYYLQQIKIKRQLAELKQQNTEAELAWLKNQLNPHFLFNTLNNISSLTQIDAEKAQDKIGQLSDLLRYALYDTKGDKVALTDEAEFMTNYIELMSMRCDAHVDIQTHVDIHDTSLVVAPMLFISPIENAFKHGVSSNKPSFIHIALSGHDGIVDFSCENSNHPKDCGDHSGSGIGQQNTARRLQLLYPGRYELVQGLKGGTYQVTIRLWIR